MSENNQNVNFWTTLPGILTGIAAVLGSIVTIIQVFKPAKPLASSESQQNTQTSVEQIRSIEVDSKSEPGTPFRNPESKPVQIKYQAQGQWSIIPTNVSGSNLPKGNISPNGAGGFAANSNKLCPGFALGALVIRTQQGECIASGANNTIDLKGGETVYFAANDVKGLYEDNDGSVSVNLSIVK
ncbi:hypothetical protein LC593_07400 [Nostoc sp. CHAB 5844]|nr:hypothetical protein [Nostoc sp. CHAB 5844]